MVSSEEAPETHTTHRHTKKQQQTDERTHRTEGGALCDHLSKYTGCRDQSGCKRTAGRQAGRQAGSESNMHVCVCSRDRWSGQLMFSNMTPQVKHRKSLSTLSSFNFTEVGDVKETSSFELSSK